MTTADHDRAAKHHRDQAHAHEVAADVARERGDPAGAERQVESHNWHLRTAHHHETQATLARLSFAEIPATRPSDEALVEG